MNNQAREVFAKLTVRSVDDEERYVFKNVAKNTSVGMLRNMVAQRQGEPGSADQFELHVYGRRMRDSMLWPSRMVVSILASFGGFELR
jgi:hypothetical protein